MDSEQFRRLWQIRFKKIFDLEKESFLFYKELLKKYDSILKGTRAEAMLKKIMVEEINHAKIARELLRLVEYKIDKKKRAEKII